MPSPATPAPGTPEPPCDGALCWGTLRFYDIGFDDGYQCRSCGRLYEVCGPAAPAAVKKGWPPKVEGEKG